MFLSRRPCPSGACSGSRSDFDDLRFDTTINFDGFAFVFSGFAVERVFESLFTEFLANPFDRKDSHTQVFSDLSVLVIGSVRVGLEQDACSSDGLCWVLACSGEAGQELALFVGESDGVLLSRSTRALCPSCFHLP